jgi:hypothetical protein
MSHHIKGAPQAQERQEVIHINTDWRGKAKPGPWYRHYYEDWDAAHPKAWVRGQAVPARSMRARCGDPPRWPGMRPGFARKG